MLSLPRPPGLTHTHISLAMGLLLPSDWWGVWFQNSILRAAFWGHSWPTWQCGFLISCEYFIGKCESKDQEWRTGVVKQRRKESYCKGELQCNGGGEEGEPVQGCNSLLRVLYKELSSQIGHFQRHLVVWSCKTVWKLYEISEESLRGKREKHVFISYWLHRSKICPMRHWPLPTSALLACTCPSAERFQQSHNPKVSRHKPWCRKREARVMDLRWSSLRLQLLKLE